MIIWINGSFGAGKTTLSEALLKRLPNSIIFDPEHIGFLIHKMVPDSRKEDFQNFPMWREHVILFAQNLKQQFEKDLIIPMTLVNPEYIAEIHNSIKKIEPRFFHFFLETEESILRNRINTQVISADPKKDQEIRQWRLDQVTRCLSAIPKLPSDTIFMNSGKLLPSELLEVALSTIARP